MFFPIGDENPSRRRPLATYSLIALNVLVFLLVNMPIAVSRGQLGLAELFQDWGFHVRRPISVQIVSAMFLHATVMHLLGNMWVLWIVGDNVEDKLGRARFLALYLAGGAIASWAFVLTSRLTPTVHEALEQIGQIGQVAPSTALPLIGASGAVFAVMGTYLVFFPEARIRMLLWFFIIVQIIPVRAKWIIGAWVVIDLGLTVVAGGPAHGSVATAAHVGGAAFGVLAGLWLKPRVGGGGPGDAWDVHTGFSAQHSDLHRIPWFKRRLPVIPPADPTKSQLIAIEDAIVREVKAGRIESALDLYPRYEAMAREKPLPGPIQIEIAHEFFRRGLPRAAYAAYLRYLETFPWGEDAAEARFRLGILLARAFHRRDEAVELLQKAAVEHEDERIRAFALAEIARLKAV